MPNLSKMLQVEGKALPHVGQLLQREMARRGVIPAEMARRMNVADTGMLRSLQQPTLQTALLWKAGLLLGHNFLADLAREHPVAAPPTEREKELEQQVADLKKENEIYQKVLAAVNIKL